MFGKTRMSRTIKDMPWYVRKYEMRGMKAPSNIKATTWNQRPKGAMYVASGNTYSYAATYQAWTDWCAEIDVLHNWWPKELTYSYSSHPPAWFVRTRNKALRTKIKQAIRDGEPEAADDYRYRKDALWLWW